MNEDKKKCYKANTCIKIQLVVRDKGERQRLMDKICNV